MNKMYFGVVEDNIDPLKLGRMRVRVVGIHPKSREELPTNKLPWATPILTFNSSAINSDFKPPVKGTVIAGFYNDEEQQDFFIMGVLPINYSELPDFNEGFSDPDGKYPKETGLSINRLARNEEIDKTIVQTKKDDLYSGNFDEPETTYNTEYPHNKVYEDEAGNVIEVDATEGAERIHVYHKSGSFVEFTNDGIVMKIKGDYYEISGEKNIACDKLVMDVNGNAEMNIDGDAEINVSGNLEIDATRTNVK